MQLLQAFVLLVVVAFCAQQKAARGGDNRQTLVIRANNIRINQPQVARGDGSRKSEATPQRMQQLCDKPATALKILVISMEPDPEACNLMSNIAKALATSGHQVTVLSSTGHTIPGTLSGLALKEIDYGSRSATLMNDWTSIRVRDRLRAVLNVSETMLKFCEKVFNRLEVVDWIRIQKFDVAVTSGATCFQSLLRLAGIQRSVIVASAEPLPWIGTTMGMPDSGGAFIRETPYFQRAKTIISSHIEKAILQSKLFNPLDEMGRRIVGERYTTMKDAVGQTSFLLVNKDELMDNSRPLTSQWIQIGGLGSEKGATLNSHWSTVLSLRPRTIVVTFNKNTACHRSKEVLLRAFSEIPDTTFICECEGRSSVNQSNIVLAQKLPEKDLLTNPHVAAFITDGRLSSLHNAMSSGKPVICIPSDREQQRNCHQLRKRGIALVKDCWDLTVKDVKELLKQISEADVRTAARSVSESVKSRAASSRERLTRTVEFAAKYGPAVNLHSSDEDVSLIQKHNMDVYIPFAILLATTALLLVWIARSICKKCMRGHDKDGRKDSHTDDTDVSKNTLTSPAPSILLHPPKMRQDTSNQPPPINSDRRGLDAAYEREQSENE